MSPHLDILFYRRNGFAVIRELDAFISGQPSFRLKCDPESRATLTRRMSANNAAQLLEMALHHPWTFEKLWEDMHNSGLVFDESELREIIS